MSVSKNGCVLPPFLCYSFSSSSSSRLFQKNGVTFSYLLYYTILILLLYTILYYHLYHLSISILNHIFIYSIRSQIRQILSILISHIYLTISSSTSYHNMSKLNIKLSSLVFLAKFVTPKFPLDIIYIHTSSSLSKGLALS